MQPGATSASDSMQASTPKAGLFVRQAGETSPVWHGDVRLARSHSPKRDTPLENAVNASTAGGSDQIVVAGAGYAGLHVALRLTTKLRNNAKIELTLADEHDYHQVLTELPRVAGGTRAADAVRIPLQDTLADRVRFVQTEINGFDLPGRRLLTRAGPIGWRRLVLALGSRPNDFAIPGLAQRTLPLYSVSDAERVWAAANKALKAAAAAGDPERSRRLATVVVGGAGATGVELAGELAEVLPTVASRHGLASDRPTVLLVEAGPTILAGSSPQLINKATRILSDLGVQIRTNAAIAAATEEGFRLKNGQLVEGGVFVWAGGVKAPELVTDSGLPTGYNGRVKVDRYLRVLDHPEIYVAGDLASVVDPRTGHALPPLAQVALEEGETVARNLDAELNGRPLEEFTFHDKGFVVSVGTRRGVADIAGITTGGQLAHLLKNAIEWEYRQSVRHLRGWDPLAR
jgi:NADH dehydrogenase